MKDKSLNKLASAFRQWRREKRFVSEPIPNNLLTRARRAAAIHGMPDVLKVTGLSWNRLIDAKRKEKKPVASSRVPAFSRVEVSMPQPIAANPLAEVQIQASRNRWLHPSHRI